MYELYVIPGSHACRTAILMLEHKRLPYRRRDIITITHPVAVRLYGFKASGEKRTAGGKRTPGLRGGDLLGTVPALAADGERVTSNRNIARFLDERHPEPPLLPADPDRRRAVEEVETWANDTFQMAARRFLGGPVLRDPAAFARSTGNGRMGYLLYRHELARRVFIPFLGRNVFAVGRDPDREMHAQLPPMLDRIDGWIADGVLGGDELNVADFHIASSIALILYRSDVMPLFEGRPALELVDRLLPAPA